VSRYYILEGKVPVPVDDLIEWARWFEDAGKRRVDRTLVLRRYDVSTVFLGMDHRFDDDGPPLLFETMIFDRVDDSALEYQERTSTWELALQAHARAVEWVLKDYCPPAARN
jgi:hypothetical protein